MLDFIEFPADAKSIEYARSQDVNCPLRHMREHFILPTRASLKKKALDGQLPAYPPNHTTPTTTTAKSCRNDDQNKNSNDTTTADHDQDHNSPAVYFCGNSLGLQPKAVRRHMDAQLETWASLGVHGHFTPLDNSPLACWQDMAADCAARSAKIVGAAPDEVVVMNTLTANLHFMMATFYRPSEKRHKIISEWKPFPSDTYAIASQIRWHGLDPATSLVELQPDENYYMSTDGILAAIDEHADDAALLLLPGLQYWSGQLFDMARITAHARARGIVVGWDLAHTVGNVPLALHDWDVDFAVWCTYKYLNAGPGAIAGAFVHERHGRVRPGRGPAADHAYTPRLAGWYGNNKATRFDMAQEFDPAPGAQGWVVSNPSAIDLASLSAALSVFDQTSVHDLRAKSLRLTAYAEHLLHGVLEDEAASVAAAANGQEKSDRPAAFRIITPSNKDERGAQLSVLLREGLLELVGEKMEAAGVVCDQRKPDVMRVAPVPMYNSYEDVWRCIDALRSAVLG